MIHFTKTLTLILLLSILFACSPHARDNRLVDIAEIVSDHPNDALSRLSSINPDSLSEADRHYFDFLSIKAKDKAYITHTSDSLIRDVIDYASSYQKEGYYTEALYYGGRVYSDLGDYPTALQYFQQTLDLLPEDMENPLFKAKVLSQTGRLLIRLRLYNKAIPYLEEVSRITCHLNDTINHVYNQEMLGYVCIQLKDYQKADEYISSVVVNNKNLPMSLRASLAMYRAVIKQNTSQIDSAIFFVKSSSKLADEVAKPTALAHSAQIYYEAGRFDSAYLFAHKLINQDDITNKRIGWSILLSPEMSHMSPIDTLRQYIKDYKNALETYFNENENQVALMQESLHNYQFHKKAREKTEKSNVVLKQQVIMLILVLVILTLAILIMVIVILTLKNRNQKNIILLQQALDNATKLKEKLEDKSKQLAEAPQQLPHSIPTQQELRERLREQLLELYKKSEDKPSVPDAILQSEVYHKLQDYINNEKSVPDKDKIWEELTAAVTQCSPNFVTNLTLLTGGKLTQQDLHTALLVKCGFQTTHMTILFARAKGTIVSRRDTLSIKALGQKMGTKVIDGIIRLL